ncbi:MAG: ABC transporter permease subunit, partial [Sphaerochaeta sp.]|nr:ABC transporter permease subunit [Sphaerochaeta sp.]
RNGPIGKLTGTTVIFSWQATVLSATVVAFPLMYRAAKGAMKQVDPDHIWAARTLGFSERRILWKILVPEAWPGIAAGAALAFARSLGEFGATMMVAGNIPGRTQTIPMAIYFSTVGGDMRTAWIWVGVITLVSAASLALMSRLSKGDA